MLSMNFKKNISSNESSTLYAASHIDHLPIQRKLSIGAVNDPLEHEADAMADKVMRMPEQNFIQRKCAHCEEEERAQRKPLASFIQKKEAGSNNIASDVISNQIHSTQGSGNSMHKSTKSFMENRFGVDFSDVKIHSGNYASQLSKDLNAQAFTVGNNIYFNDGKYQPESNEGKHLLAHELTHTIQQKSFSNYKIHQKLIQRVPLAQGQPDPIHDTLLDEYSKVSGLPRDQVTQHDPAYAAWLNDEAVAMQGQWNITQNNTDGTVNADGTGNDAYASTVAITFTPVKDKINCSQIAFIQNVKVADLGGSSIDSRTNFKNRITKNGWTIDRLDKRKYGWYGFNNDGNPSGTVTPGSSPAPLKAGVMTDRPSFNQPNTVWSFETCSVCKSGTDVNKVYSCFLWGFDVDAKNKVSPHSAKAKAYPGIDFNEAIKQWNAQTAGDAAKRNDPHQQTLGPFSD